MAQSSLHPLARPTGALIPLGPGLQSIAADGLVDRVGGAGAKSAGGTHDDHHDDHHEDHRRRAQMLERGVITRAIADHSLTFCPPLINTDRQVDQIIDTLAVAASE